MFELYEQEARKRNIDINPNPFMPESEEFDLKRVKNMVKKGLVSMAEEIYNAHTIKPSQESIGKLNNNLSAKELIEKYNKI